MATLISTEAVSFGGAASSSVGVTVPAGATAVYLQFAGFGGNGHTYVSSTLAGNAPAQEAFIGSVSHSTQISVGTGTVAWYDVDAGPQTLAINWSGTLNEGPVAILSYVRDGDRTSWRDVGNAQSIGLDGLNLPSTSVASSSTDLVLRFEQRNGALPTSDSGWTTRLTQGPLQTEYARLSTSDVPGASTTAAQSQAPVYFNTISLVSIPFVAGPQPEAAPDTALTPELITQTVNPPRKGGRWFMVPRG